MEGDLLSRHSAKQDQSKAEELALVEYAARLARAQADKRKAELDLMKAEAGIKEVNGQIFASDQIKIKVNELNEREAELTKRENMLAQRAEELSQQTSELAEWEKGLKAREDEVRKQTAEIDRIIKRLEKANLEVAAEVVKDAGRPSTSHSSSLFPDNLKGEMTDTDARAWLKQRAQEIRAASKTA